MYSASSGLSSRSFWAMSAKEILEYERLIIRTPENRKDTLYLMEGWRKEIWQLRWTKERIPPKENQFSYHLPVFITLCRRRMINMYVSSAWNFSPWFSNTWLNWARLPFLTAATEKCMKHIKNDTTDFSASRTKRTVKLWSRTQVCCVVYIFPSCQNKRNARYLVSIGSKARVFFSLNVVWRLPCPVCLPATILLLSPIFAPEKEATNLDVFKEPLHHPVNAICAERSFFSATWRNFAVERGLNFLTGQRLKLVCCTHCLFESDGCVLRRFAYGLQQVFVSFCVFQLNCFDAPCTQEMHKDLMKLHWNGQTPLYGCFLENLKVGCRVLWPLWELIPK